MFTYYQMALDRLLRKGESKLIREFEMHHVMRRIRNSDKVTRSMEEFSIFNGLYKKYKYDYCNTVNVSIDTENSIIQELKVPFEPAPNPF
jgi:hypothetical protein